MGVHVNIIICKIMSGLLNWVATEQITKACTLHFFLLHYKPKECLKRPPKKA